MTQQTLAERRLQVLRDLADNSAEASSVDAACEAIARTLTDHALDVPFALLYLLDADGQQARLAASAGLVAGTPASPAAVELDAPASGCWPLGEAARDRRVVEVADLEQRFGPLDCGPYPESPRAALVLPIAISGLAHPFALLVAGVSARRALDEAYRTFYLMLRESATNALTNARNYEEERKRAEALAELDRAKTAFFSNVSHEFRTPLTLMLGPLEDLLGDADGLSDGQRERLEMAHRSALRLLKLVNTLLDFSRIEAGRIQAVYEPTDLATLTEELASVFRSAIERAGLRLVVDCPPLAEPAYVDREMWEKIVLNLLSNAFKFTFEGEIAVRLRRDGGQARLTVADSGTGIPTEELPRIFERFHRIQGAAGRSFEGTGIGLALVQELVKLHGGTVWVESEVGRGSTFAVAVPLGAAHLPTDRVGGARTLASTALRAEAYVAEALRWVADEPLPPVLAASDEQPAPPAAAWPAGSGGQPAPAARILLADDNADLRDYVRRLLGQHCEVVAVPDGAAALHAARSAPFDLVLTDVMMPGLDGFELLAALRADERTRTLPILLLSARAGEESRVEGMEAGADDYLVKPFSARELLARVRAHLDIARARREAELCVRASEERFRALVNAGSYAVYCMSPDWSEMRFLHGRDFLIDTITPRESWLGQYVHPDDQARLLAAIDEAVRTKRGFELEHRVRRADGTLGWTFSRAVPILNAAGEIVEWFGAASDVTARKRLEAEREELRAREEAARAESERLQRAFLAAVSHELLTPVAILRGYAETLANPRLQADPRVLSEAVTAIHDEGERLERLVRGVIVVTRAQAGRLHVNPTPFSLEPLIRRAAQYFQLRTARHHLRVHVPSSVPTVLGDRDLVVSVVYNLLDNAIKYSPQGGVVQVVIAVQDSAVAVSVQDEGLGIEPADQARIFEPYYRAPGVTASHLGGAGLGLYLCAAIVQAHGGQLRVESSPGQGATFDFTLPRADRDPPTVASADDRDGGGRGPGEER
ncbi:MAG TPA: ATP-binding protein [Chloroflexota bacterium]|jgi:signal transduction histidine kinase/FixJ family two-component response regulator